MDFQKLKISDSGSPAEHPSVLVVGAGLSGIGAATFLYRNGFKNVTVIDANSYAGGRCHTVPCGDTSIDMGAHFVLGTEKNPLFTLAMEKNLLTVGQRQMRRAMLSTMPDGSIVSRKNMEEVDFLYAQLCCESEGFWIDHMEIPTYTEDKWGSFIRTEFNKRIKPVNDADIVNQRSVILDHRIFTETHISGADSLDEISLSQIGSYEELTGLHCNIPNGFGSLVDALVKEIPSDRLFLNHEVTQIIWDDKPLEGDSLPNNKVICKNGSTFEVNHVIITIPLGVLKEKANELFSPKLPQNKLNSIEALEFGVMNKIAITFAEPVISDEVIRIQLYCDRSKLTDPYRNLEETWSLKLTNCFAVTSRTFITSISGREAVYIESVPEEKLGSIVSDLLKGHLNRESMPPVEQVIRTRWSQEPFVRGSFTFIPVGAKSEDVETLSEPLPSTSVKPSLLFAGEATHIAYYSTAHGAFITGEREATRIIDMYTETDLVGDVPFRGCASVEHAASGFKHSGHFSGKNNNNTNNEPHRRTSIIPGELFHVIHSEFGEEDFMAEVERRFEDHHNLILQNRISSTDATNKTKSEAGGSVISGGQSTPRTGGGSISFGQYSSEEEEDDDDDEGGITFGGGGKASDGNDAKEEAAAATDKSASFHFG